MVSTSKLMRSYGIDRQSDVKDEYDVHCEELKICGYTVVPDVLSESALQDIRSAVDAVYTEQVREFGEDELACISETNLARCLLSYDPYFFSLVNPPSLQPILERMLGEAYTLHLQNAIINRPDQEHHQTCWHRDLPYQDWVCSKSLAICTLLCIDDFNDLTGGTFVLPHSHRLEMCPSSSYLEKHQLQIHAPAGSAIVFDAMLYHRAGLNHSSQIRRGINHVYTVPILKQQIDIPAALSARNIAVEDEPLRQVLGYPYEEASSVQAWRTRRKQRL